MSPIKGVATGAGLYSYSMSANPTGDDLNDPVPGGDWLVSQNVKIINNSWGYTPPSSTGNSKPTLYFDYLANQRDVIVVTSAGNSGPNPQTITIPADAYNGISVGATGPGDVYNQVTSFSSKGVTQDGRSKPDLVAPGTSIKTTTWTDVSGTHTYGFTSGVSGTSFSAPLVAGVAALLTQYGTDNNLSTNHNVIKAVLMNSASKDGGEKPGEIQIKRTDGNLWQPANPGVVPLDNNMGAGEVNALAAFVQYKAGEALTGIQNQSNIPIHHIQWDRERIGATGSKVFYPIIEELNAGTKLTATLVWDRYVERLPSGGDPWLDTFNVTKFSDLDLMLLDSHGAVVSAFDALGRAPNSISGVNNVEHIYFTLPNTDFYTLLVYAFDVVGSEDFSLAVLAHAVPLPPSFLLVAPGLGILWFRRRRV